MIKIRLSVLLLIISTLACGQLQPSIKETKAGNKLAAPLTLSASKPIVEQSSQSENNNDGYGGKISEVRFKRGSSSAIFHDSVVSGTTNLYIVKAKAGQQMTVSIKAVKKPGIPRSEKDTTFDIMNEHYSSPINKDNGQYWSGKLPNDGEYLIDVGGNHGNTGYTLKIEVK